MNANDPQLTAYALDELDPRERAQIEQLLRENPQAADEVASVQSLCTLLSSTLRVEAAEPLSADHRDAVLLAAGVMRKPLFNVVEEPSWWKSWQFGVTAAACMVFGFGAYAIFDALTESRPKYASLLAKADGVEVGVPSAEAAVQHPPAIVEVAPERRVTPGNIPTPELPAQSNSKIRVAAADIGAKLQPQTPLPELAITPDAAPLVTAAPMPPAAPSRQHSSTAPMVSFSRPVAMPRKQTTGPAYDTKTLTVAEHPMFTVPLSFGPSRYAEICDIYRSGKLPAKELVDMHALVNEFKYQDAPPVGTLHPVALHAEVGPLALNPQLQVLRIAVQARAGGGEVIVQNASVQVEFNAQRIQSYAFFGDNDGVSNQEGMDIRAGQGITAMCLLIPASTDVKGELLKVRLRYTSAVSRDESVLEKVITKPETSFTGCSADFRWASFVTCTGWFLTGSGKADVKTLKLLSGLVGNTLQFDPDGKRSEFVQIISNFKDSAGGK